MASTVVGLFDNRSEAESVVRDLNDAGFRKDDISYVTQDRSKTAGATTRDDDDSMAAEGAGAGATAGTVLGGLGGLLVGTGALLIPGVGPALVAGSLAGVLGVTAAGAGIGAAAGGLVGGLVGLGVPEEHANYYAEGVRRGGTLVTVHAEDNKVSQAAQIMRRHGAVDIDKRAETYKSEGFNRFDEKSQPYAEHEATAHRDKYAEHRDRVDTGDKAVLEEVEEDIKVGKRQVQRGGVRVFSRVTETPVEKDVTLRDEEVHVSRRNVDRPATNADFKEGSIEVTETDEEAVVSKDARVTGEVVVDKTATEHTQKVRDTVRKTEVEVEEVAAGTAGTTTKTTPRK